ncbi:MAG TPA: hypothetical protein VMU81_20495 [Acetobacteraceae bacterium]|jgi:hypothetical protein|nr:hypothetical protein [Acetobacteraceae bacterium]
MPFDALVAPPQPLSLFDEIADQGIASVSLDVLAAHKQAQLERFAPSFWYRHQPILPIALLGSVACMAVSGGVTQRMAVDGSDVSGWLTLAWMCVIAMLIGAGVFRVRAGSHWEERWVPAEWLHGLGVPEPIAAYARELSRRVPGTALILGELKQEHVVLDPYLMLERDGEQVCLGIWDGGEVIACASWAD